MHQVQSTAKTTSLPSAISDEAMAVRGALLDRGLETPMVANHLSRDQRYDRIRDAFTTVMETLGLDDALVVPALFSLVDPIFAFALYFGLWH